MAQRTTVVLLDDLDGAQADQTVEFGLDGTTYEIDLSTAHAQALRAQLAPLVSGGRAHHSLDAVWNRGRPSPHAAFASFRSTSAEASTADDLSA